MANYHQVKNAAILTPTTNTDLGSDTNRYSNVFMSGNIVMSNGVTVTSTNVITPKIASVTYPGNDTAADTAGGQTITITGTGFSSGASVLIGGSPVAVVTVVNSTSITFTSPPSSAGNYALYVVNSDGGTAIYIPGVAYSGTPTWSTSSGSLATVYEATSISSTVTATGDATISYSVASGTLPTGSSLNTSTGLISGTAPASAGSTTYTFTIRATDGQNQDTDRSFSITVNTDSVSWSSPADNTSTTLTKDLAMSTVTLSATSAAGKSITYTANSLPTGLSISTNTIVGTPTVVGSTTSLITATATGSSRTATRTLSWVVSVASDTYWPYTSLLINGEGAAATNNAQNNTLVDSSTNAISITRNGDIVQGTFSPFSASSWSWTFDGTGDCVTIPSTSAIQIGTGDFTVECWAYLASGADVNSSIFATFTTAGAEPVAAGMMLSRNYIGVGNYNGGSGVGQSVTMSLLTWTHVALTRASGSLRVYLNGVQQGSTQSDSRNLDSTLANIGGRYADLTGSYLWNGYISNLRLLKGTALYTASSFTPPTTPLTAITNTVLLTCQSNRFKDNSTTNATLTRNGDVSVTKFSPFNGTTTYDPATHGGSVYLSGSPWIGFSQPALTSVFTIESWLYFPAVNSDKYLYVGSGATGGPLIRLDSTGGTMSIGRQGGMDFTVSTPYPIGQWFHFALVRQGTGVGQTKVYYNGVLVATGQSGSTFNAGAVGLGSTESGGQAITGYISGWRLVSGTAVYTGSFTPPTAPPTAIANTTLLLNFTNAGVIDQTGINLVTTNGDTKISTSVKKYNSGSISFDGAGDYLSIPNNSLFTLNNGKYTIEFWVYFNSLSGEQVLVERFTATSGPGYTLYKTGSNTINLYGSGSVITNTTVLTTSTWYHIAVTYDGTNTRIFVNGTLEATAAANITDGGTSLIIGSRTGGSAFFNGYIDDLRITKGYARYTANFTAPTSALITV